MRLVSDIYTEKKRKKKLRESKGLEDRVTKLRATKGNMNVEADEEKHFEDLEPGEINEVVEQKES